MIYILLYNCRKIIFILFYSVCWSKKNVMDILKLDLLEIIYIYIYNSNLVREFFFAPIGKLLLTKFKQPLFSVILKKKIIIIILLVSCYLINLYVWKSWSTICFIWTAKGIKYSKLSVNDFSQDYIKISRINYMKISKL